MLTVGLTASAQYYIPPDPFNDMLKESYGIWPNMGQVTDLQDSATPYIKFYTTGALPRAYFHKEGTFSLVVATPGDSLSGDTLRRLDITCAGEHAQYPDPVVWEMKDQYAHFYLPSCAPDGATFVHPYHRVIYPGIYPHIDMHIYSGMVGQKIAFVINPEGDPKDIELKFTGQDQMDVDIYGNLKLLLEGEWVTIPQAMAYQVANDGSIIPVNWTAGYDAYENVGRAYFNFSNYDHGKPLVFLVGPPALGGNTIYEEEGLCWSTYYGAEDFDMLTDIKPDSEGNFYVAGRTESPILNFPSVTGTSITPGDVHSLATLTKFNQSHLLQWTAFLGNSNIWNGGYTEATGLAIKADPVRIYLVGNTASFNFFPTFLAGAYNEVDPHNTQDKGFLARFDDQGVRDWATIYGMSKVQIHAVDVVPHADQIVISGTTEGNLPGDHLNDHHGGKDAFVALFDANESPLWSRFYGGANNEDLALVKAAQDRIVLAGNTESSNIPVLANVPTLSFAEAYHGSRDIFIAQYSYTGNVEWATYLGGPDADELAPKGIAVNKDLYLTGSCGTLPTMVEGDGWNDQESDLSGNNGFIAEFAHLSNAGKWITYLGGGDNHSPYCLTLGQDDELTVGGYTNEAAPGLHPWPGHYYQPTYNLDQNLLAQDGFIANFDQHQDLRWYTLFGGDAGGLPQPQNVRAVSDFGGSIYAVGYTTMPNGAPGNYFPLDGEENAGYFFNPLYNYNGLLGGASDAFITQFCDESVVGVAENQAVDRSEFRAFWTADGVLNLLNLADGLHQLRVYDPQGRLVLEREVRSAAGRSGAIAFAQPSMAVYIAVVDGQIADRFIPLR